MAFIPNSPVPAALWREENVAVFEFYNIPILCMKLTCQLCVRRYKYSNSVIKGRRSGILNLLISNVHKLLFHAVIGPSYLTSRRVYKKTESMLFFLKDDPTISIPSKIHSAFGSPGRRETFRFFRRKEGEMKCRNYKQTTPKRMKCF